MNIFSKENLLFKYWLKNKSSEAPKALESLKN